MHGDETVEVFYGGANVFTFKDVEEPGFEKWPSVIRSHAWETKSNESLRIEVDLGTMGVSACC